MINVNSFNLPKKIKISTPLSEILEIRLRAGRPTVFTDVHNSIKICSEILTFSDINEYFTEICRYSIHSYQNEIAEGFITLDGGHRVGITGTTVKENGKITFIKDISGLNVRVARDIPGCSDEIFNKAGECSLIIAGKPMSGKTTILRDLARRLGQRRRVTVIDSRGEIAAAVRGVPSFDVGLNTDVLTGCEKSEGITLALRSMNPEFIICDELAHDEQAVEQALLCGVKIIASAHSGSLSELERRYKNLSESFEASVMLGGLGKVLEFKRNGAAV